ncbi:TetR/AcrR family transcriptional regulator [Paraburkholderia sp. GAS42]|uniref:TetR/AcrR family transcriptional regulator n=1 Tax=Paraburkholderia sp. GAS42 TaxID=3035135 RepID=UPI003D1F0723
MRQTEKRENRRIEIADHAIRCFAEHGYAETSLRDIAEAAEINLGQLHYYFESKNDLILYTIRRYKTRFIGRLVDAMEQEGATKNRITSFIDLLTVAATRDAKIHRLWYDLRAQALFNPDLRAATSDIERDLEKATSILLHLQQPEASRGTIRQTFLLLDAHFFNALQMTLSGEDPEGKRFRRTMRHLLVAAIPNVKK